MNENNLNRIKGILSAKNGTLVPKFLGGFVIYHKSTNQPLYSKDGTSWFTDEDYMSPFTGSLDEFTEPELGLLFYTKNSNVTISGLSNTTPSNTTPSNILDSSIVSNALNNIQSTQNSNKPYNFIQNPINGIQGMINFANYHEISEGNIINTLQSRPISLNTTPTTVPDRRDIKSAHEAAMKSSAGMQLSKEDQKLSDLMMLKKSNIAQGISTGIQSIGNIFGANLSATDSQLTKNIDTVYNGVSSVVSNMGPVGQVAGMVMNTLGAIGNISQAMGGGTDQQTKLDSWMDSPLLSWNVGAINGFFGKNTDSFGVDLETLQQVGGSYGGITTSINEAAESADKEYGLFSGKARKKANDAINKAKQLQNSMKNISDLASDQQLAVQSMGEQAGLAYSMMTDGGYNQKYTYAAKEGGILEWKPQIKLNWELPEFKEGGNITEKLEWIPELQKGNKIRTLEELIEYAKKENPRFIQRFSEKPRGIEFIDDKGNKQQGSHLLGWELDENGNAIVFPSIQEMENGELKLLSTLDAYDRAIENNNYLKMTPEEAKLFTESGEDEDGNLFGYKIGWPDFFKNSQKNDYTEKYPQEYLKFKESLPDNHKYTPENEYRMYKYWQLWGKPENFEYTLNNPNEDGDYMFNWDTSDSSYHGSTIAWGDDGIGYFIKPKHHDTILYELDYYNDGTITKEGGKLRKPNKKERESWEEFRRNYILEDDGDFYKYVPVKQILQDLEISQLKYLKEGGSLGDKDIPEIEETTQKNVIPEGALHKNKHHMEHAEGLTKKGIPVIDEEGEQQAEIEHSEIIFTLEVTKKLEEYYQIFYSEESSNKEKEQAALDAGKLLVYQILENTEDRTGLIESCKKGGSLTHKISNDSIKEISEWIPNIVIIEKEFEKNPKNKEKSEKDNIKDIIKEVLIEILTNK